MADFASFNKIKAFLCCSIKVALLLDKILGQQLAKIILYLPEVQLDFFHYMSL